MTVAVGDTRANIVGYALSFTGATLILLFSLQWHFWVRRSGYRDEVRNYPKRSMLICIINKDDEGVTVAAQANLEYCSVDVLLEIASYLDCEDILRLRQVRNGAAFRHVYSFGERSQSGWTQFRVCVPFGNHWQ